MPGWGGINCLSLLDYIRLVGSSRSHVVRSPGAVSLSQAICAAASSRKTAQLKFNDGGSDSAVQRRPPDRLSSSGEIALAGCLPMPTISSETKTRKKMAGAFRKLKNY